MVPPVGLWCHPWVYGAPLTRTGKGQIITLSALGKKVLIKLPTLRTSRGASSGVARLRSKRSVRRSQHMSIEIELACAHHTRGSGTELTEIMHIYDMQLFYLQVNKNIL